MTTNIKLKLIGLLTAIALWTTANVAVVGSLLVAFTSPNHQSSSETYRLPVTRLEPHLPIRGQRTGGI
jgi:hypothetical protein